MPQRWFLLSIAINQYQSSKIRNLAGCLNDAELLRSCLCSLLGTPSESAILSLTDAEATRAAIISAFFTHLIENPEIRVGDPIIIFYSGQGGMPSLCPADWQQDVIPAIPDVTMNALLRLLARYKGSNITFICDSCYYREVRNPSRLPDIDLAILKRAHRDGTEFPFRDGSHILLAACSVNETAHRERLKPSGTSSSDGQYPCGVFTKALTERLSVLRSQSIWQHVTYSQLMASLTLKDQNPRCSGYYQNCLLFRDRRESAPCFFRLLPATDTYRAAVEDMFHLDAGLAHGISVGTKINVYRKVSASECLGVLEVCTIRPLSATARRVSGDHLFDVPAPCWAGIRTWAAGDLRVYASSSVAKSISLPNSQSAFNLLRADDKESSHISLHLKPDGYITIERQDPLMKSFSCHSVTSQLTVGLSLPDALQRIAHFYFHLGRRISEALLDSNDLTMSDKVSLCMNHVVQDNDGFPECGPPVTFSKNTFYLVGDKPPSNSYSLTISNLSDHAFYVYLFSMDPTDYSIIPLYFPQSPSITPPLGPRNSFTIGDPYIGQGWEEAIKFTGDDGKFLKLILCNRWIDLTYIAQPSVLTTIVGTLPPRPDGRDRMEAEFATVRADEFFEGGRQITPPDRSFFKLAVGSLKANLKQITQSSVERATAEGTLLCSPSPGGPLGAHMNRDMIQCIQCLMGLTFRKRRSLRLLHRHGRVYREHS
ncbi:hypothetical protein DFH06DRAFT_685602 [Mycena polygramma]|nr:hypothetical protein DFH06DRAFT_685602 [Mycena polygramma]